MLRSEAIAIAVVAAALATAVYWRRESILRDAAGAESAPAP